MVGYLHALDGEIWMHLKNASKNLKYFFLPSKTEFVKKCIESISRAYRCSLLLFTIYIWLASLQPAAGVLSFCLYAFDATHRKFKLQFNNTFAQSVEWSTAHSHITPHLSWQKKTKNLDDGEAKVARRRSDKMLNNGVSAGSLRLPPIGIYKLAVAMR